MQREVGSAPSERGSTFFALANEVNPKYPQNNREFAGIGTTIFLQAGR